MMDYNNLILDTVKTHEVDEWCDLNPSKYYDESNRDEGEREIFYSKLTRALIAKTETVDNLTECVMYLTNRLKALEAHVEQITGKA